MLNTEITQNPELTEESFNRLLPDYLRRASKLYFTPIYVAQIATQWLTEDGPQKVLDIGAGVGKFCIAGAKTSDSYFHGIEYRPSLAKIADGLIHNFGIKNAIVQNRDIKHVDFTKFTAFYLFNPFYENMVSAKRLNNEVLLKEELYSYYYNHTKKNLDKTASGTRLVTFHGNNTEVPESFRLVKESKYRTLKLWIKE